VDDLRDGRVIDVCIAYPGRVIAIEQGEAVVDVHGRERRASTLFLPDIRVGEWVAVAAGTIVERLDPAEAAEISAVMLEAMRLEDEQANAEARGGSDVHAR